MKETCTKEEYDSLFAVLNETRKKLEIACKLVDSAITQLELHGFGAYGYQIRQDLNKIKP